MTCFRFKRQMNFGEIERSAPLDFVQFLLHFIFNKMSNILSVLCVVICISSSALVYAQSGSSAPPSGGISDGGGNVCTINGRPYLLELSDLATFLTEKGIQIDITENMKILGHGSAEILYHRDPLKNRIDKILEANKLSSPIMVSLITQILERMQFVFTVYSIQKPAAFDISHQPYCQNQISASVLFMPPMIVWVDTEKFNLMDLDSQAALIVHESLREVQLLLFELENFSPLKQYLVDLRLQKWVRALYDIYRNKSSAENQISSVSIDDDILLSAIADQADVIGYNPHENKALKVNEFNKNFGADSLKSFIEINGRVASALALQIQALETFVDELHQLDANDMNESDQNKYYLYQKRICFSRENLRDWFAEAAIVKGFQVVDQLKISMALVPNKRCE